MISFDIGNILLLQDHSQILSDTLNIQIINGCGSRHIYVNIHSCHILHAVLYLEFVCNYKWRFINSSVITDYFNLSFEHVVGPR
jgi:hypothetical protein